MSTKFVQHQIPVGSVTGWGSAGVVDATGNRYGRFHHRHRYSGRCYCHRILCGQHRSENSCHRNSYPGENPNASTKRKKTVVVIVGIDGEKTHRCALRNRNPHLQAGVGGAILGLCTFVTWTYSPLRDCVPATAGSSPSNSTSSRRGLSTAFV